MRLLRLCMSILLITLTFGEAAKVFSAPDPIEVEEKKLTAPIHLIGLVRDDLLYKDLSEEKSAHFQIRKMELEVIRLIKGTHHVKKKVIDVYYTYIPSWESDKWSGGKRMDIAVKDKIEIWLDFGEYGLESTLGGNTLNHLYYEPNRPEHIKEPIIHLLKRNLEHIWSNYLNALVIISLLSLLMVIILFSFKKTKGKP